MTKLKIAEQQVDDVTFLVLSGDLIFGEETNILRNSVRFLLNEGQKKIFLDMKSVGYVDSSGIGELVSSFTVINRKNSEFKLLNLPPRLLELLRICKLLTIFETEH